MPYSRSRVLYLAATCLALFAPAVSVPAAEREQTTSLRVGQTTASLTRTRNGVRVSVTTPPTGRQSRVRTAQRARLQRMMVSQSDDLQMYQQARAMQAEIRRANEQALARRRNR